MQASKEEIEQSRGKMYEDSAEPAERKVRASLILEVVADKEGIEVGEDEINEEIKKIAEQNKIEPAAARRRMIENGSLEGLKDVLREEKAMNFLLEKAKVAGGAPGEQTQKGKEDK